MTDVQFDRLEDLSLRKAWPNEAADFTPWLARNIDDLAAAIGIPIERREAEIAVGPFSADIKAHNPQDDTVILIENQLEESDHRHLGQILTYLAGLDARTVIWIAARFREEHLSAVRWLNEHTADGFSFFAVRLRVVRIGNSPFAPIFEVLEKPNNWDRRLKETSAAENVAYYDVKQQFWETLLKHRAGFATLGVRPWRYSNNYLPIGQDTPADISIYLARHESGIYVRSRHGQPAEPLAEVLLTCREQLEHALGTRLGDAPHFLIKTFPKGHMTPEAWPEIADWLWHEVGRYRATLAPILGPDAAQAAVQAR